MRRDAVHLGEPKPAAELAAGFPRATDLNGPWYRAHSDRHLSEPDRGCWWFASYTPPATGSGRFDLASPNGTCYLADDVEAAVRERLGSKWGTRRYLTPVALRGTVVSEVTPGVSVASVADTDNKNAVGFVTRELASGAPYNLTQRHAAAFHAAGFAGLLYRPRFTPGAVRALAVFGQEGPPNPIRPATEVADWRRHLRTLVRRRPSRHSATVIP